MRNVRVLATGSNVVFGCRIASMLLSACAAGSISVSAWLVGTMRLPLRTSKGSPVISRKRRNAMLTVGCDCPSRLAARDTLDSVRSVCSTRIMCESMLSLDIVRLDLWRGGHLVVRRGPVSSQYTDGYCDGQRRA